MRVLVTGLLWFSAIGCGLMAGLYFAFSTFIMTALGRIDQAAGIAATNAINKVIEQTTAIVIAHRLSTVMHADRIVVLNHGAIEAGGSHDALLQVSPTYQTFCRLQFDQSAMGAAEQPLA